MILLELRDHQLGKPLRCCLIEKTDDLTAILELAGLCGLHVRTCAVHSLQETRDFIAKAGRPRS